MGIILHEIEFAVHAITDEQKPLYEEHLLGFAAIISYFSLNF